MKFASHLKQTTFAVAALLAGGAGLMTSMDGRASDAVSAGVACAADKGWDMACLRQLYAQPIARWPRPQVADGVTPAEMAPVSAMPQPQVAKMPIAAAMHNAKMESSLSPRWLPSGRTVVVT